MCRLAEQHVADLASHRQALDQLLTDKEAAVAAAERQAAQALQATQREHRLALMVSCCGACLPSDYAPVLHGVGGGPVLWHAKQQKPKAGNATASTCTVCQANSIKLPTVACCINHYLVPDYGTISMHHRAIRTNNE